MPEARVALPCSVSVPSSAVLTGRLRRRPASSFLSVLNAPTNAASAMGSGAHSQLSIEYLNDDCGLSELSNGTGSQASGLNSELLNSATSQAGPGSRRAVWIDNENIGSRGSTAQIWRHRLERQSVGHIESQTTSRSDQVAESDENSGGISWDFVPPGGGLGTLAR